MLSRRSFLKATLFSTAALSVSPALIKELKATSIRSKDQDYYDKYEPGTWTYTVCNMCFWTCGVKVKNVNGVVKKIEGIPGHPLNDGKICAKGNSGIAALYDENRLKYPLIRVGEKGSNKWRKVSWEEAFSYISKKVKPLIKEEPETIHLTSHGHGGANFKYLLRAMGSKNIYAASWTQ